MCDKAKRLFTILEAAQRSAKTVAGADRVSEMVVHTDGYAESGYDGDLILVGNFNVINHYVEETREFVTDDNTPSRVGELAEKLGAEIEWNDEWYACDGCHKLVRTSADSYGWRASYWQDECTVLCADCVREDPEEYLKSLEGCSRKAVTFDIDLEENGYVKLDEKYESGLYGGQCDDPAVIAKSINSRGIDRFIFEIDSVGQFDLDFSLWIHKSEVSKLSSEEKIESEGADPAEAMKRGLQNIPALDTSGSDGIAYHSVKSDGTVESRTVSPEEFVRGIGRDE